jgi:subtilase family protein
MALRFLAFGMLAVLSTVGVSSAVAPVQRSGLHAISPPGAARLYAFGTRSVEQRSSAATGKLDAVLADLSRHLNRVRPAHPLADLHSLSPAAKFTQRTPQATPLVLIDAVTRGDPQSLQAALQGLGLEHASVYGNDVGGWLPVTAIGAAAARAELVSIRAALSHTRGAVALQGDYVQHSALVRSSYSGITGAGITVGVLSDSFNCYAVYAAAGSGVPVSGGEGYAPNGFTADYATDVSTGALPSGVNVLAEPYTSVPSAAGDCLAYGAPTQTPFSDEGRAMLQVVHAVAPGATLAFYTAEDSEADFANGIKALAAAGAKVIADDVGYFDEPFFQDGLVADAVNTVEAGGVAYFSAAGNDSNLSYENTAPSFATAGTGTMAGDYLLNFDTTGASNTTSLPVTVPPIPPGDLLAIVVEWDQPYVTGSTGASPGATSSIDLCVTGATGSTVITDSDGNSVSCTGPNAVGVDPVQILVVANPANAAGNTAPQTLDIMVGLAANSAGAIAPGRIIVYVEDDGLGSTIDAFATGSATIQGHPGAAGAAAVGAAFYFDTPACGTAPAQLESFSSEGGAPILFSTAGTRLAIPIVRQKPDFVAPDGINTTFLGFTLASDSPPFPKTGLLSTTVAECQNNTSYPNFFGTSAATPHAAGIAALALQANPGATPAQIYASLSASALPMSSTTPNFNSGYGFIQADAAFVVPTLTLAAASVPLGSSTTLTWSTIDASSCTASANPATNFTSPAAPATSGTLTVMPAAAGATVYTFTCTGAAGTSASNSVTLLATSGTVAVAPTLTLASTSVAVGKSTTITWSSANATSCTASGSWSGTLASSGSQTITPAAVGTETFTLACSNLGGTSAPVSVSLDATAALAKPPAPTLTLGASSIHADTTTSITWSSAGATSCTASGNANANQTGWQGTQAPSATFTITPDVAGTFVYSMFCSNAAGDSPTSSVTLTVTPSIDTGGGGALDPLSLLVLGGCVVFLRRGARAWVRTRS